MGLLDRIFRREPRQNVRTYDGAAASRRTFGVGVFGRANAEIGAAGQTLASRSGYSVENNSYIRNGVENLVAEIAGSGIRPVPRGANSARLIERFERWTETADADGRQDFYGLLSTIVRQVIVSGEAPVLFVEDDNGFKLRVLPHDQIDWSVTRNGGEGAVDVQGVRLDPRGRRIGYWVRPSRETDPWDTYAPPILVPAEDIAHVFKPTLAGQVHGVPWTASIILAANEFDRLTDALLMGVSVSAMFAGVITNENEIGGDDPFEDNPQSLEPGAMIRLKGGQRVTFSSPAQAQETSAFVKQQLRGLAAGLGVPAFMLDGDVSQANYSSLRASLLPFRRRVEAFQYGVLVPQLLRPIWRRFLASEVLSGNLDPTEASMRVDWIMPRPLQVDPAKDVQAVRDMIEAGLMSRRQAVNELGWSVEELDSEIAADRQRETALGLNFEGKTNAPD